MNTHALHRWIVVGVLCAGTIVTARAQVGGAVRSATEGAAGVESPVAAPESPLPPNRPMLPEQPVLPRVGGHAEGEVNATVETGTRARDGQVGAGAGAAVGGVSATLNSAATLETLRKASIAERPAVLAAVETRLGQTARAVAGLRRAGARLEGAARAQFNASYGELRGLERTVKRSLQTARRANAETWSGAREQLAIDFDAYAQVVAQVEVLVARPPSATPEPQPVSDAIRDPGEPEFRGSAR